MLALLQGRVCTLVAAPTKSIMGWNTVYLPSKYVIMVIDGNSTIFKSGNMDVTKVQQNCARV